MRDLSTVIGIVVCIAASLITGISLYIGFIGAIIVCAGFQWGNFDLKKAGASILKALAEVKILYVVIFMIGASVSSWLAGGVVQTLMIYGLKAMLGRNVILMTFLITAVSGFFMGSAIGTISTLGIAILGIGAAFEIPLPILLGAAVSGAFISDKISPLSGLMNLTLSGAGALYKDSVKAMLKTLIPTVVITCLIYYMIGAGYVSGAGGQILKIESAMNQAYVIHPALLFLPVMVIGMAFLGRPSFISIGSGIVLGGIFSVAVQGYSVLSTIQFILFGYKATSGDSLLDGILRSGGMFGMTEVILIIMGAVALSDLMETTALNERLFGRFFQGINSGNQLLMRGGLVSIVLTALTCDQTAGIVLPMRILRAKGKDFGVTPAMTVRTISDSGTIVAPLMPWNINALIIIGITGIGAVEYAPYAFLCMVAPVVHALYLYIEPVRK